MNIVFFLIPLGLLLFGIIVWAFIWAVNHGQFEDLDRAAHSILYEPDEPERNAGAGDAGGEAEAEPADSEQPPPDGR